MKAMNRREFMQKTGKASTILLAGRAVIREDDEPLSIGMIGLDTSHCPAFTKVIHATDPEGIDSGFRVTHAYPFGSRDIESSTKRIPEYTKIMQDLGVSITESIEDLLREVDVVLLETNDGRLHLEQAREVIAAGKPLFIDKPMAASLSDVTTIFNLASEGNVPIFSSSSLRFSPSIEAVKNGKIGDVVGAATYSPAKLEPTHPDLFWYGIHGVESLFTLMGPGCESVRRIHTSDTDVIVGFWSDGRVGTFTGLRSGKTGYGGTAFGTEGIIEAGKYEGYDHLVYEILDFFRSGEAPVKPEETLEIFAFMEAAEVSKKLGGATVTLASVQK